MLMPPPLWKERGRRRRTRAGVTPRKARAARRDICHAPAAPRNKRRAPNPQCVAPPTGGGPLKYETRPKYGGGGGARRGSRDVAASARRGAP